ncbi:hypothetical protein FYJ77_06330 [Schaalia hyovaginalis]|nr:hypothetical protein [Schaalia hyovaginalis]
MSRGRRGVDEGHDSVSDSSAPHRPHCGGCLRAAVINRVGSVDHIHIRARMMRPWGQRISFAKVVMNTSMGGFAHARHPWTGF